MKTAVTSFLLLIASHLASAQPSQSAGLFPNDRALDRKVTLACKGEPLADILKLLQSEGGPRITAAKEPGWERLSLYAKDRPIREIMSQISTLLHYDWATEQEPGKPATYTLVAGQTIRALEKELLTKTLLRGAEPLEQVVKFLNLPKKELDRLMERWKNREPVGEPPLEMNFYPLTKPGPRSVIHLYSLLSTDQKLTLLQDEELLVRPAEMTEPQRADLHRLGMDTGNLLNRIGKAEGVSPEQIADMSDRAGLKLSVDIHPVTGAVHSYSYSGVGPIRSGAATFLRQPLPTPILPARGNPYSRANWTRPATYATLQARPFPRSFTLDRSRRYSWRDLLGELAASLDISICSDDYSYSPEPQSRSFYFMLSDPAPELNVPELPDLSKVNLQDGLDAICRRYRYLWWYRERVLHFRSLTWFLERPYEVPPPLEQQILEEVNNAGRFTPGAVKLLAQLTRRQLMGLGAKYAGHRDHKDRNVRESERWDGAWRGRSAYPYIQFCAQMTPALIEQALANGIPVTELPQGLQAKAFELLLTRCGFETPQHWPNMKIMLKRGGREDPPDAPKPRMRTVNMTGFGWDGDRYVRAGFSLTYEVPQTKTGADGARSDGK